MVGLVGAQQLEQEHLLPRPAPSDMEPPAIDLARPSGAPINDSTILVHALLGLSLIDDPDESAAREQPGIDVELLELPGKERLALELERFIGRPISLASLEEINRTIIDFARRNDRPVVDAFALEGQDITAGFVQVVVVSGRRGSIRVEGIHPRQAARFEAQTRLARGSVITESTLRSDLAWFNRNPFRRVDAILEPGDAFGETDIVYDVVTRTPLRWYGGLEDSGARVSGKERWLTGANWGDAFGFGHQLNYQFTSSFDVSAVKAHSFSYSAPLPWRHIVDVFGSHVQSAPDFAQTVPFELGGKSWQLGMRYRLPLATRGAFRHELAAGYDFKRSNNDLEFGSVRVASATTVVSQFVADYSAAHDDRLGNGSAGVTLFVSPGGMYSDNRDANFERSRAGASADYIYGVAALSRATRLPYDAELFTNLVFQYSNRNLLGSEQLGVGGYRSVRGYDDYEVPSDIGLTVRNELRAPGFAVLGRIFKRQSFDHLQAVVFTDYGIGRSKERLPSERTSKLWSAGVGVRYTVSNYLNARVDYGWQLRRLASSEAGSGRLHVGMALSY